ncbi:MAG: hypothetical protein ACO1PZ_12810 [Gammaproteobacteria bacterium]
MAAVRHLPQQWKWIIAAAFMLSLACVLAAQYSVPDLNNAGVNGTVLVVKEGDADDAAKLLAADDIGPALPPDELSLFARPPLPFSTAFYMSAAYLVTFIIAPSRAPPQLRFV